MEQPPPPPPLPDLQDESAATSTMSLPARLLNVFAAPGEVFSEVKKSPASTSNWLVPVICTALAGVFGALVIFSQPAIMQSLHEQIGKNIDQQVKSGKLTQAQADQALPMIEKFTGPTMLKIFGCVGAIIMSVVHVFWWGFILWLLSRSVLKVDVPYSKALEVVGLAMMIPVLGAVVGTLLIVNFGRLGATPSLAFFADDFDASRKSHQFLAAANFFYFWQVVVTAAGLGKITGLQLGRGPWLVAPAWLLQECFLILVGLGQFAL